jgi:hypothetical protein
MLGATLPILMAALLGGTLDPACGFVCAHGEPRAAVELDGTNPPAGDTAPDMPTDALDVDTEAAADDADDTADILALANAEPAEAESLNRLAMSKAWTSRALAVMRLERYECEASAGRLRSLTRDDSWRVRAYAYATLARRGVPLTSDDLDAERNERVLRTVLRCRYPLRDDQFNARIALLEKSPRPLEAMVALEMLAALDRADDEAIRERMGELLRRVVLRMSRTEAGVLSRRLASITNGQDTGRDYRWREWYRRSHRKPGFASAALVAKPPSGVRLSEPNRIASLDPAAFIAFEGYLASVAERPMDLAILIDCTASMWRELADAQSSADDLMEFLNSVTAGARIAIIGYRDRTDVWETRAWDFTRDINEARTRLWSLSAEGGGDRPESVYAALKLAFNHLSWLPHTKSDPQRLPQQRTMQPEPIRACVLVGDAPPHPGEGTLCVEAAKRGFARGIRTYGVVARESETNLRAEGAEIPAVPSNTQPAEGPVQDSAAPGGNRRGRKPIAPPRPPPALMARTASSTWFPEIAEAGGGRAELIKEGESLVAEIAQLTIADKFRAEFGAFFESFRLLCR